MLNLTISKHTIKNISNVVSNNKEYFHGVTETIHPILPNYTVLLWNYQNIDLVSFTRKTHHFNRSLSFNPSVSSDWSGRSWLLGGCFVLNLLSMLCHFQWMKLKIKHGKLMLKLYQGWYSPCGIKSWQGEEWDAQFVIN